MYTSGIKGAKIFQHPDLMLYFPLFVRGVEPAFVFCLQDEILKAFRLFDDDAPRLHRSSQGVR